MRRTKLIEFTQVLIQQKSLLLKTIMNREILARVNIKIEYRERINKSTLGFLKMATVYFV